MTGFCLRKKLFWKISVKTFYESGKTVLSTFKTFQPFSDISDVVIAEKEIKLGHVLLHVLKGVLLELADIKLLSLANLFHLPRALKMEPLQPYFTPRS